MKKLSFGLLIIFLFASCVQEIPVEELEEETFTESSSKSDNIPIPSPPSGETPIPPITMDLSPKEILNASCLKCHGGSVGTFAGLDINNDSSLYDLQKKFIVKGNPEQSKIYLSLTGSGGIKKMPTDKTLSQKEQDIIKKWISEMTPDAPVKDTTKPSILSESTSDLKENSITILWQLNEKATGQIEYGKTANYGNLSTKVNSLQTNHNITLTGLEADSTYHYRIRSIDESGNELVSTKYMFTTIGKVNQAPTIQVDKVSATVEAGKQVVFTFDANDPEGKELDWTFSGKPTFTSFVNTGNRVVITLSPKTSDIGDYTNLRMIVKDLEGLEASVPFTLKVIAAVSIADRFTKFKNVIDRTCVSCHGAPDSVFGGLVSFYNKDENFWKNSRLVKGGDAEGSLLYQRLKKEFTNFVAPGGLAQNMPTRNNGFNQSDADAIKDYILNLESTNLDCSAIDTSPSVTEVRRLNSSELKNSLADLFGASISMLDEIDKLPLDGEYDGFSTVGSRQQASQTFVKTYEEAIEKIVDANISKIINCSASSSCTENILFPRARMAWSKELSLEDKNEIKRVVSLIQNNSEHSYSYAEAINAGMRYILLSPQFIYAVHESAGQESKIDSFNDYELAKRLSLLIWKSIPDSTLLDVAKNENLASNTVLIREAKRMMSSSKFSRSGDVFVNEWLRLARLDNVTPDPATYNISRNDFNALKPKMKTEVQEFYKYITENNLPLDSFINGKFTVVDKTLADHYGMSHPGGDFQKIDLPSNGERGGISTLGGILAMNSNTNRRSIVLSGVWFLNALLCDEPGAPGNDIADEVAQALASDAPHRDLAGERASNPSCSGCHLAIDGAGLPFNTFDSVGKITNTDEKGRAVDSFGEIYLKSFNNTHEFLEVVKKENRFKACLTNKMLIYATGETLHPRDEASDMCKAKNISDTLTGSKDNIKELILGVVTSENFLKRNVP